MVRFTQNLKRSYFWGFSGVSHNDIMWSYYLLEVEFLEHGDADLVVQPNLCLKPFDPKFGDSWWKRTHWSPPFTTYYSQTVTRQSWLWVKHAWKFYELQGICIFSIENSQRPLIFCFAEKIDNCGRSCYSLCVAFYHCCLPLRHLFIQTLFDCQISVFFFFFWSVSSDVFVPSLSVDTGAVLEVVRSN